MTPTFQLNRICTQIIIPALIALVLCVALSLAQGALEQQFYRLVFWAGLAVIAISLASIELCLRSGREAHREVRADNVG